jgi:6-phosphofructokinase 1
MSRAIFSAQNSGETMSKVFVIAQGGGPTAVINQTVAGAALTAMKRYPGARVLGARHGVRGLRDGHFIELSGLSETDLRRLANTPNAALGSTRDKPDAAYCDRIQHQLHAVKTDAFMSVSLDFHALPGIYVGVVMGRHAGFLTAASSAWKRTERDGPHLVYVPEIPFSTPQFIEDVRSAREKYGYCIVAMSEGVTTSDGKSLVESLLGDALERDSHGNVQLSTNDLGMAMQTALAAAFPKARARVDTFGYLPRAFSGTVSPTDQREAFETGAFAVEAAEHGSCSVALGNEAGSMAIRSVPLAAVAGKTRLMPRNFLDERGTGIAAPGLAYLARLLPPVPDLFTPFV